MRTAGVHLHSMGENESPKRPVSQRKIDANRANSKHSTGPKTEAGKAKSAENSDKHGFFAARLYPTKELARGRPRSIQRNPRDLCHIYCLRMVVHGKVGTMKCLKCGSQNLKVFSAEMSLAAAESARIYSLQRTTVCLECGFSQGVVSHEALMKLRMEKEGGPMGSHRKPDGGGANRH